MHNGCVSRCIDAVVRSSRGGPSGGSEVAERSTYRIDCAAPALRAGRAALDSILLDERRWRCGGWIGRAVSLCRQRSLGMRSLRLSGDAADCFARTRSRGSCNHPTKNHFTKTSSQPFLACDNSPLEHHATNTHVCQSVEYNAIHQAALANCTFRSVDRLMLCSTSGVYDTCLKFAICLHCFT